LRRVKLSIFIFEFSFSTNFHFQQIFIFDLLFPRFGGMMGTCFCFPNQIKKGSPS